MMRGRIIKTRTSEDGTVRSFEVKTESGATTLRNARHLRHQTKKMTVRWAADGATKPDDAAEPDTSSRPGRPGRPRTSIVTEPRRTSERLAERENRF